MDASIHGDGSTITDNRYRYGVSIETICATHDRLIHDAEQASEPLFDDILKLPKPKHLIR